MHPGDPSNESRPTNVRWIIFVLACAASWLLYLHRYSWGIIRPAFKSETGIDEGIGWLDGAFQATYALGQIPAGMAGDRFGPRATLALFTLVWSLAVGGVGWTTVFWRLVAARGSLGLAQAGAYPVLNKMTRIWFPLSIRTSVQGWVAAMGRIGGACAPLLIATILIGWLGLSWQSALLVISVPGLVLAVAFWLALRNRPREHPWTNEAERELLGDHVTTPTEAAAIREGPPAPHAPVWQLTAASAFSLGMMFLYIFVSTFQDQFYINLLPSFLKEGRGFDDTEMGLWGPWPLVGGAVGGVIGGYLNDWLIRRTGNRRWSRTCVALTGKMIAAGVVLLSIQFADGRITLLLLIAARVFSDWSMPTQWATVTDIGGRAAATVFAIINTVGAVGGFVAGPVFAYLNRTYGWDGVFYGVAAMCASAALTWLFIDCTKRVVAD
jgi:MFS family permease